MAIGRRRAAQQDLFVSHEHLQQAPGHPFYERLSRLLAEHDFDVFAEKLCAEHYAGNVGRPGLPPGTYFRLLLLGYFENLPSERQIAWRVADSLTLRQFVGYQLTDRTANHSTISKTRRLLPLAVHTAVFVKVLEILAQHKLLRGKTLGVDATTLEANAAMRSIRDRVTGQSYQDYVRELMAADPEASDDPSDDEVGRYDRRRKGRKTSNQDWHNPHNPDAKITKMKDGRTHFAEKCEQAVDLDTGAVVAISVQGADVGDTSSIYPTLSACADNLNEVKQAVREAQADAPKRPGAQPDRDLLCDVVSDKGYHSRDVCEELSGSQMAIRTYLSEPARGRQKWQGREDAQKAVYANRRRIGSERGKQLMRRRGELLERPFAHYLDHGGMRRVWLKGHENIRKRLLIQVAGFNLGLVMRQLVGSGTPRQLRAGFGMIFVSICACFSIFDLRRMISGRLSRSVAQLAVAHSAWWVSRFRFFTPLSTGC